MSELTIIPIVESNKGAELVAVDMGSFPIRMPRSEIGGFVMDSLEITTAKAVATFHQEGAVDIVHPNLMLLDENGEDLDFDAFVDHDYNRETGVITVTHTFRDASAADIARVKKVGYFIHEMRLNEDEAVHIKLK